MPPACETTHNTPRETTVCQPTCATHAAIGEGGAHQKEPSLSAYLMRRSLSNLSYFSRSISAEAVPLLAPPSQLHPVGVL
jgi:hypothetical protein